MTRDRIWATVVVAALCALQIRCHPGSTAAKDPMTTTHDCTDALRALAAGDLAGWHGLADDCTTATATAVLGPQDGPDRSGVLGGSPTAYRVHPSTAAAPDGVYVWHVDDRVVLIRMHDVTTTAPILDQLGEPEARELSKMPGFKTQWIYAARGLTLHVDDDTGAVAFLYAYRPMSVDEFRASWLSQVTMHRTPVE